MSPAKKTFCVFFGGLGGITLGFQKAGFRCLGAWDIDPEACADHEMLTGVPEHCEDLATLTLDKLRTQCRVRPDVLVTSPPCKGFSGCLPTKMSKTQKYVLLNNLALRGIYLALEAWAEPPPLIAFENVPRIKSRGRDWLQQMVSMLHSYGYAVTQSTHDCGVLGGLAQHRRRFLLVARHMKQVPEFLYEPPPQRVRAIGEVFSELPMPWPGAETGGRMHQLPRLTPLNWLRLACIPAGGDWRNLPASIALKPRSARQNGGFGVNDWDRGSHTVVSEGSVRNTWASVADTRLGSQKRKHNSKYGVGSFEEPSKTITGNARFGSGFSACADPRIDHAPRAGDRGIQGWQSAARTVIAAPKTDGASSVADPRLGEALGRFNGKLGMEDWEAPSSTVMASAEPARGRAAAIADPRLSEVQGRYRGGHGVEDWDGGSRTVIGDARASKGAAVADPRVTCVRREGSLGISEWDEPTTAVIAALTIHNWPGGVDDPRAAEPTHVLSDGVLYGPPVDFSKENRTPCHMVILAEDGTWHRPMTTLELAALQDLPTTVDGKPLDLTGGRKKGDRQRIGNAVPPKTAQAIAASCARTLDAAAANQLLLSSSPVWVSSLSPPEVP